MSSFLRINEFVHWQLLQAEVAICHDGCSSRVEEDSLHPCDRRMVVFGNKASARCPSVDAGCCPRVYVGGEHVGRWHVKGIGRADQGRTVDV